MAIADATAKPSLAGRIDRELGAWPLSLKIGGTIFFTIIFADFRAAADAV